MYKYKDCDRFIRNKADEMIGQAGLKVWQCSDEQLDYYTDITVQKYGLGPHDVLGNIIRVGDRCAVALTASRSSNMCVIEVDTIVGNTIKGKTIVRTYGSVDGVNTYKFPERMVRL